VGSILDLLNAQAALELARAEGIRARADYLVSLAQLARAAGRLDLAAGARAPAPGPSPAPGGTATP
jgi:outer membrane protein TolC